MGQCAFSLRPLRIARIGCGFHLAGHTLGTHECVEVTVFAALRSMGMIVVLGVGLGIIDIALGIMLILMERSLMGKALTDEVLPRFLQQPQVFPDGAVRLGQPLQFVVRCLGQCTGRNECPTAGCP